MLLFHHHLKFIYHWYYVLQFFSYNSAEFAINASKAYLFFCDGCVCYIINIFIKIMKRELFNCGIFKSFGSFKS